jgi:nucleoside triphosphate diphosphatase
MQERTVKHNYSIDDLLYLMNLLRDPEKGCPWDIKQNYASIAPSTIEEAYEVVDAIEKNDFVHLKEELGDLLFQVIFYSQLGREESRFDFFSVVSDLVDKLVRRHPHVFAEGKLYGVLEYDNKIMPHNEKIDSPESVKKRWDLIKEQERQQKGIKGTLADVPLGLPALSRAAKLQKRAATVGFDWDNVLGPIAKVREELMEVEAEIAADNKEAIVEELGDLLFAVVNIARYLKVDPEQALRGANQKFEKRFAYMEAHAGQSLTETSIDKMNQLWDEAKLS